MHLNLQALTAEEINALLRGQKLQTDVNLLDGSIQSLGYDITTSVQEAVEELAKSIDLENFSTFTLYEVRKIKREDDMNDGTDAGEEHLALDDNRYIADVLSDMQNRGITAALLFKKRMFRCAYKSGLVHSE